MLYWVDFSKSSEKILKNGKNKKKIAKLLTVKQHWLTAFPLIYIIHLVMNHESTMPKYQYLFLLHPTY